MYEHTHTHTHTHTRLMTPPSRPQKLSQDGPQSLHITDRAANRGSSLRHTIRFRATSAWQIRTLGLGLTRSLRKKTRDEPCLPSNPCGHSYFPIARARARDVVDIPPPLTCVVTAVAVCLPAYRDLHPWSASCEAYFARTTMKPAPAHPPPATLYVQPFSAYAHTYVMGPGFGSGLACVGLSCFLPGGRRREAILSEQGLPDRRALMRCDPSSARSEADMKCRCGQVEHPITDALSHADLCTYLHTSRAVARDCRHAPRHPLSPPLDGGQIWSQPLP
ncbi:hypothetical protein GGS23DRAFT_538842 [Durotheca rogersii]|uniref:uncharacterized protein n=1 Tax=Durotheca rogersii TaxID=419775 RepID=UPI00221FCEC4|nr:uncharacterized protein GGS23DRAFT_538842 [Durotheca rogersii]KAI5863538.1 hypothetical protein GGS23DRAFT_538842 [Durotheca rogersii]